jgi:type I restriction enzyme S subunit
VFDEAMRDIDARASNAVAESRTLAALRATLLPKLISGELRVKETHHLCATEEA